MEDRVSSVVPKAVGGAFARTPIPYASLRWGLVASASASSGLHNDANGFCTWIRVEAGSKVWAYEDMVRDLEDVGDLRQYDLANMRMSYWYLEEGHVM